MNELNTQIISAALPPVSPVRTPAEAALGIHITTLSLTPADILLVKAPPDHNLQTLDHLAGLLRDFLPSKRFIIFTSDLEFTVVKDHANVLMGYQGAARC